MAHSARRIGIVVLVVVVLTAGCQAPTAGGGDSTPSSTATADGTPAPAESSPGGDAAESSSIPEITIVNGSLSVDPGLVFSRVQSLQGTDVDPPTTVSVFDNESEFRNSTAGLQPVVPPFWELAGIETGSVNGSDLEIQKNGYVTTGGTVAVYLGANTSRADEQLILAHEFTHYVQVRNNRTSVLRESIDAETSESDYLVRAIKEGAAVFTADEYMREYADADRLNSPWYEEIAAAYPAGHAGRVGNSRYILGYEYVATRFDSPSNLSTLYENPPRTTEQLRQHLPPGTEPPTRLNVTVETNETWFTSGTDQKGEAFLRYTLASDVGQDSAAQAATGWGNDSLHIFRSADHEGFVWVLDFDDAANATEYQRIAESALDARGDRSGANWNLTDVNATATVVNVSATTRAFVVGSESFVATTRVSGEKGETAIAVGAVDDPPASYGSL